MPPPFLPVSTALPALRAALQTPGAAVLEAAPGAGKTTAVPLELLAEPWLEGRKIVMLEPRRLAARAAARRMASTLGEQVGRTVGYRVRFDTRVSAATRIETYLQMVNMAEKVHRIRRRRAYLRDSSAPQPFGFVDILQRLKAQGVDGDEIERALATIRIEPVFMAHPTEVTRRTLLRNEQNIARHLVEMMDPYLTPNELEATLGLIRQEMTTGWQTVESLDEGIRLRDEAEHVLFFLTDVLYRVVPPLYESLEGALASRK